MRTLRFALLAVIVAVAAVAADGAPTPAGRSCCHHRSACKSSPRAEGSCCRDRPTEPLADRRSENPNEGAKSKHLSESLPIAADSVADARLEAGLEGAAFLFPTGDGDAIYLTIKYLLI